MRYEDASSSFSQAAAGTPDARDDADVLAAGSPGPATGNTITGAGTITGTAGADVVTNGPGEIVALEGAGGSDTSDGGSLHVAGRFGEITMDGRGSYTYEPNDKTPDGGRDVFRYTLADSEGARDTATLTIDIGREVEKIDANAQQLVPGPDGVVTLPPGVQLSDVHVVGRNLVIDMPDGTQMIIIDGAVFVPQLVLGGVEVPASNLAALLIDAEPQPAGGIPQSSGGNFAIDVPPLDPGVPLGDLIPPTELAFEPPIFEDVGQFVDEEPEILIQPDGQPASVAAVDIVNEAGLPTRNEGEPAGSGESADGNSADNDDPSETTTGVILVDSPDDPSVVGINGEVVTGVIGQEIEGDHGILTITSFSDGQIGYSYTLGDNTSGNATFDDFSVSVTDNDGDVATATLRIDIIDDVPTARNDTDASVGGIATGNVITDAAPGDLGDTDTNAADTVGADNATLTSVSGAGGSDSTFSEGGLLTVNGNFGTLNINAAGNYTYTVNPNAGGGGVDVFTYTLTDGDGNTTTATLTITNPDLVPETDPNPVVRTDDDAVPEADGNPGGVEDNVDAENLTGTLSGSGGDGALTFDLLTTGAPAGLTYVNGPDGSVLVQQGGTTVLTITINAATGAYTVEQNAPIDHPAGSDENNVEFTINYTVTDVDGDSAAGTLVINVDDDTPEIVREDVAVPTLLVDETDLGTDDTDDFSSLFDVQYGADGAGSTSYEVNVVDGTDSGLVDVATGESIFLFNDNGVIEGRVGDENGVVAFTVSVVSATGVVTLNQIRALEHPNAANPDDPVSPDADSIQFTVNAIDGDGDPVSESINIGDKLVFEDDGPTAVDDTDSVIEGASTGGNVLTGAGGDGNPAGADTPGADGFPAATVVGVVTGGNDAVDTTNANVGVPIAGTWGTLTLNANGTYTYTATAGLNPPPGTTDVFTYTVIDNDGDRDSATLTISVIDDLTPTVDVPTTGEAGTSVDEQGLPIRGGEPAGTGEAADGNGTDNDDASEFTSGTINFTPGDAPAVVTIDGAGLGGPVTITGPGQTIVGEYGTMTINTFNAGTGVITYTYQLTDNVDHDSDLTPTDTFVVTVTDVDGDVASANLVIAIVDDEPIARDDTDSVVEGASTGGNVLTGADTTSGAAGADTPGADGFPAATVVGVVTGGNDAVDTTNANVGVPIAGTWGTLTLNANGTYTYTATAGLNPPPGTTDVFTYTVIDNDGDRDSATLTISVIDDLQPVAGSTTATVDDEGLANGIPGILANGDLDANVGETTPSASEAVFNGTLAGTDGDGTTTFLFQESLEATHPTVGTERINYVVSADGLTLTATVAALDGGGQPQARAGEPLFTVVITNADTGAYTLTLQNNILHDPVANGGDNTENDATLLIPYQMRDADGDLSAAAGSLTVTFDDDMPREIQPDAITEGLNNEVGASESADLDDDLVSEVITDFGADGPGLVQFANIDNGDDSGFTSDDDVITYWLSNNGQTLQGRTNSTNGTDGQLIFTVAINQAAGDYTVTMSGTIDNGAGVTFDNLTSTKAGNVDVRGVGADDPLTTVDLLLTASKNGANATINTSSTTVGSANQSMDLGETIRIDFVTNLEDDPTDTLATFPSGFSYDGHVGTQSFLQAIPQVGANQAQTAGFRVYALNTTVTDAGSPDDTPVAGLTPFSDSTTVQITHVTINGFNDGPDDGTPNEPEVTVAIGAVGVWTTIAYGVSAQLQDDGSVIFAGVQQGDQYGITTGSDFNAVAISSVAAPVGPPGGQSTTDTFDLGVFSIGQVDSGDPIQLTYDLQITDADGDTVPLPGAIDITIDPAGTPAPLAATTQSLSQESFEDTSSSSLLASDSPDQHRTMSAANNNSVLLGAIAAAGLGTGSAAAAHTFAPGGHEMMLDSTSLGFFSGNVQGFSVDSNDTVRSALGGETMEAVGFDSSITSLSHYSAITEKLSLTDSAGDATLAPTALLKGTQVDLSDMAQSTLTSAAVGMPSVEMLAAAANENAVVGQAHGTAEVGRVLVDALAGGGQGLDIDAVIDAVANHEPGGGAAIEGLASIGGADVSAWHMGGFGGFTADHSALTMETMAFHIDAVQPAA